MTLYHIAPRKDLPAILKQGLVPMIGRNSMKIEEDTPRIYMSDKESLPYWKIVLGYDPETMAVLSMPREPNYIYTKYTNYGEFMTEKPIPPESIAEADRTPEPTAKQMRDLCSSNLYGLSQTCVAAAVQYEHRDPDQRTYFQAALNACLAVLPRLDWRCMTTEEKRALLSEYGEDGEYTFLDTYKDTGLRLWEQLALYPDDDLSEKRKALSALIGEKLHDCLDLYTGGWGT